MIRRALLITALLFAPAGAALAQDVVPSAPEVPEADHQAVPSQPPFVWTVDCRPMDQGSRIGCRMSQIRTFPDQPGIALRVDVVPSGAMGNTDAVLRVSVPHGIVPSALIGLSVDEGELFRVQVDESDADGLYATAPIGRDFMASMRSGRELIISVILSSGAVASIPVSLFGFSAAHDAVIGLESGGAD